MVFSCCPKMGLEGYARTLKHGGSSREKGGIVRACSGKSLDSPQCAEGESEKEQSCKSVERQADEVKEDRTHAPSDPPTPSSTSAVRKKCRRQYIVCHGSELVFDVLDVSYRKTS